jgi:hypothetical protein
MESLVHHLLKKYWVHMEIKPFFMNSILMQEAMNAILKIAYLRSNSHCPHEHYGCLDLISKVFQPLQESKAAMPYFH